MSLLNAWGSGQQQQQAPTAPTSLLSMLINYQQQQIAKSPRRAYAADRTAWISGGGPPVGLNFQTPLTYNPLAQWSSGRGSAPVEVEAPAFRPGLTGGVENRPMHALYNNGDFSTQRTGSIMPGMIASRYPEGYVRPPVEPNQAPPPQLPGAVRWDNEARDYVDANGIPLRRRRESVEGIDTPMMLRGQYLPHTTTEYLKNGGQWATAPMHGFNRGKF